MSQEQTDGDVKPSNNGGGSVAPQGHANIFEWMNVQVLTDPVQPQRQQGGQQGGQQRPAQNGQQRPPQGGQRPPQNGQGR